MPVPERLHEKLKEIIKSKSKMIGPCLVWQGTIDRDGYGKTRMRDNGSRHSWRVHRLAFELEFGEIPVGMCVCHRCDNPSCVELKHLFLGTRRDNMADMASKNRGNGPGPPLPRSAVAEIRTRSISITAAASRFGVTRTAIIGIRSGNRRSSIE